MIYDEGIKASMGMLQEDTRLPYSPYSPLVTQQLSVWYPQTTHLLTPTFCLLETNYTTHYKFTSLLIHVLITWPMFHGCPPNLNLW